MKKIFTLCLVAFAFVLGTQNIEAQSKTQALEIQTKTIAKDLKKELSLDDSQEALLARAMYAKELAYVEVLDKNSDMKNQATKDALAKIDTKFKRRLMEILSPEQFKKFSALQHKLRK
ncbi:hypothetical protein [Pontimicrobium sp. IMCC45349]|jgi:hypothetical protein|uniref:hypothetical protein n=1 Tax=Pontimicrobium sp. IMCC45349 TaxID=3391574 RepID=UPI0039A35C66